MRNSLLAILIAFGTTVAMPASAAVKIEHYAFQPPETQHQQMQEDDTGKIVATGSTAGLMIRTPSATSGDLAAKDRLMTDSTAGTGPG
jgi:hypothetical protein